jgi:hypothetical protein
MNYITDDIDAGVEILLKEISHPFELIRNMGANNLDITMK